MKFHVDSKTSTSQGEVFAAGPACSSQILFSVSWMSSSGNFRHIFMTCLSQLAQCQEIEIV
jgi:hypothetical protein